MVAKKKGKVRNKREAKSKSECGSEGEDNGSRPEFSLLFACGGGGGMRMIRISARVRKILSF
jgi:hypothetical protein